MLIINPETNAPFTVAELTGVVNEAAYQPGQIQAALPIDVRGIRSDVVMLDRRSDTIDMVDAGEYNGVAEETTLDDDESILFKISSHPDAFTVRPEEGDNRREFGQTEVVELPQGRLSRLYAKQREKFGVTWENQAIGALRGYAVKRDGSIRKNFRQIFDRAPQEMEFDFSSSESFIKFLVGAKRQLEAKLTGVMIQGWKLFVPSEMTEEVMFHGSIVDAFERWNDGLFKREDNRSGFPIASNVWVEEYRNAKLPGGRSIFPEDELLLAPIAKIYNRVHAAKKGFTTIGEVGAPIYSSQKDLGHDEGVEVKSETNCETYVTHLDGIGIIKNG